MDENNITIEEKRKILDDIFSNQDKIKFDSSLIMPALCIEPAAIFQYATDWSEELDTRFANDKRMIKIFNVKEDDERGISPTEIKKFIYDHVEDINCKKLIMLMYYNYIEELLKELQKDKNEFPRAKVLKEEVAKKFNYLRDKYISKDENIESVGFYKNDPSDKSKIKVISSKELLYNQKIPMPKMDLSDAEIEFANQFIKPMDFKTICTNPELGKKIEISILDNDNKNKNSLIIDFLNQDDVKRRIDPENYYVLAAYRLSEALKHVTEYYMLEENKNKNTNYVIKLLDVLKKLGENVKKYNKGDMIYNNGKEYTQDQMIEMLDDGIKEFTDEFMEKFPEKSYEFCLCGYLNQEQVMKLLPEVKYKEELLAFAYEKDILKLEDIKKIIKDNKAINDEEFKKLAMIAVSKGRDYKDLEQYIKWPLDNEKFYSLLNNKDKALASSFYLINFSGNAESNKFYSIVKNGDASVDIIKRALSIGMISENNLKEIVNFINENNLQDKYNISELEYNQNKLISSYKQFKNSFISKVLKKNGIDDEEKVKITKEQKESAQKEFEFQEKLFISKGLQKSKIEVENIVDKLGYIGLTDEGISDLYKEGLISSELITQYVDRETFEKMIEQGLIKDEDIPNDFHDNITVLIRLAQSNKITNKDIVTEYLSGKISPQIFNAFTEKRDMSDGISLDKLSKLFKDALPANENSKDKKENFKKYFELYTKFSKDENPIEKIDEAEAETIAKNCYGNADNYKDFYQNRLIGAKTLSNAPDSIIADIMKMRNVMMPEDMYELFRDTDINKHEKRDRLEKIFIKSYTSNYTMSDEEKNELNKQKWSVLLNVYGNSENEKDNDIDNDNLQYFVDHGYVDIDSLDNLERQSDPKNKNEKTDKTNNNSDYEQSRMPLIKRIKFLKGLDKETLIEIVGSTNVFYLNSDDKVLLESMGTKKKKSVDLNITDHATYCLDKSFYENIKDELFIKNDDKKGINEINWPLVIEKYREKTPGVKKAYHKATTWENSVLKILEKSSKDKTKNTIEESAKEEKSNMDK